MTFLILLVKVFIFSSVYFFMIGILNAVLSSLSSAFRSPNILSLFYSIVITVIYIYLYSLWGAFYVAIVETYSAIYLSKWWLVFLCIASSLLWIKIINKQLQEERMKMLITANSNNIEDRMKAHTQSSTVIAFSLSIFILLSFLIFLFTRTWQNKFFFNIPEYFARLFI